MEPAAVREWVGVQEEIEEDLAWEVVLRRDRRYDGVFVYAVRTTGVYCRPSCPSRRPKKRNATFFHAPEEAEAAGFRACKRCHPRSEGGTVAEHCIRKAVRYIHEHVDEVVTLDELARHVGLSPFHLQRTFKERVGLSPRAYQNARRLERMKDELREQETVTRAIFEAGFGSVRGAYEQAAAGMGMTPGQYKRGGRGLRIRYAFAACPHGRLVAAATEVGICSVLLGKSDDALREELRGEFPQAQLSHDLEGLAPWLDEVVARVAGEHPGRALPLDLHGTAFQIRVWKALQEIPHGETRSYKEVAEGLGRPRAARAVAGACAANRAAVLVPCHRVVRTDGALSGYRWGEEVKQRLLRWEVDPPRQERRA